MNRIKFPSVNKMEMKISEPVDRTSYPRQDCERRNYDPHFNIKSIYYAGTQGRLWIWLGASSYIESTDLMVTEDKTWNSIFH